MSKDRHHWLGNPILDPEHAKDLESDAAVGEFKDRLPRDKAEKRAHENYVKSHHLEAAAHHFRGMAGAKAAGDAKEAGKHSEMYEHHMKALGHDHLGAPPDELKAKVAENKGTIKRFKAHPADILVGEHQTSEGTENHTMKKSEKLDLLYKAAKMALGLQKGERECAHCGRTIPAEKGHACPEQTKWLKDNKESTAAGKKGVPVKQGDGVAKDEPEMAKTIVGDDAARAEKKEETPGESHSEESSSSGSHEESSELSKDEISMSKAEDDKLLRDLKCKHGSASATKIFKSYKDRQNLKKSEAPSFAGLTKSEEMAVKRLEYFDNYKNPAGFKYEE